jgi:hypothetical protein
VEEIQIPKIETGVPGPDGQPGFLLVVPRDEVLDWDIQSEIGSASRFWVRDRQAWWVAAAYLHTAQEIVGRFPPPPVRAPSPAAGEASPPRRGWRARLAALRSRWRAVAALLRPIRFRAG